MEVLSVLAKISWKTEIEQNRTFVVVHYFTWKLGFVSNVLLMIVIFQF